MSTVMNSTIKKRLFRHRHGKEVLSEETGRGKEVIERREVFDMPGIG
jgi:hypothetical protein